MQIKLNFLGAVENVTGSRYLLEVDGTRVLIDCGLYQERQLIGRNWDKFSFPPGSINAVLVTHAHLDHCGLLPKLIKDGFKGKVYCTEATAEIAKIVLLDSGHLQEEDARYKRKRHKKEGRKPPRSVKPLYTVTDAQAALPYFSPVKYKQTVAVSDSVEATFYDAGHILGASMIKVKVSSDGQSRTILFSGDLGRINRPILRNPTLFEEADYCFIESTYGDRIHDEYTNIKDNFADIINDTFKTGGKIVVPSFSVERAQEILYYLNELFLEDKIPHMPAFLDSPMAIRVTEVFKDHPELFDEEMTELLSRHESPFDFAGLKMVRSTKESKAISNVRGTAMIIAGSGMCTGGRVKHHLVNNISRPESTILFVGYQATGTLGRRIINGETPVRILGQNYHVKARIARLHGFSGHADKDELLGWLKNFKTPPKKVFVVHGESEVAHSFAKYVTQETGFETIVPTYQQEIVID